eukprot:gene18731-biopygen901
MPAPPPRHCPVPPGIGPPTPNDHSPNHVSKTSVSGDRKMIPTCVGIKEFATVHSLATEKEEAFPNTLHPGSPPTPRPSGWRPPLPRWCSSFAHPPRCPAQMAAISSMSSGQPPSCQTDFFPGAAEIRGGRKTRVTPGRDTNEGKAAPMGGCSLLRQNSVFG